MVIFFVLSASLDGVVRLWENETGNCSLCLVGHREPVYSVSYSPDGKFIATGSSDRCVNIWSTQVMYNVIMLVFGGKKNIQCLSVVSSSAFTVEIDRT